MPIVDPDWLRADEWLRPGDTGAGCDISLFGVPTSTGSLSGSRADLAPAAFRESLNRFSTYHSEAGVDVAKLAAIDGGDWDFADMDLEQVQNEIEVQTRKSKLGQTAAVFVGGDNSITRPLLRGTTEDWASIFGLLTLDAHHDLRTLDNGPTNGTPVRGLIEDGLSGERISQVGIANFANSHEYADFAAHNRISVRTVHDIELRGIGEVMAQELHHLSGRADFIYVDFDMDVLDVAYAPGCPGARPGGLTPRQLMSAAFLAGKHPKVIAADFVEVDPERDPTGSTVMSMVAVFLSFCAGVAARPFRS